MHIKIRFKLCIYFALFYWYTFMQSFMLSWPCSHVSWIYNYLWNQCLSPLNCGFHYRSGRGVQHYVIKFVSDLRQFDGLHRVWNGGMGGTHLLSYPQPILGAHNAISFKLYVQIMQATYVLHGWLVGFLCLTPLSTIFSKKNWKTKII
jgi:hypothetical protein